MSKLLAAAALLAAIACARPRPSDSVLYRGADGSFEARVPGDWRVQPGRGLTRKAAFFGPATGARPYSEMIRVALHERQTPKAYQAAHDPGSAPALEITVAGRPAWEYRTTRTLKSPHGADQRVAARTVMIAAPAGLFVLEHSWPADAEPTGPFAQLLDSFKPRP